MKLITVLVAFLVSCSASTPSNRTKPTNTYDPAAINFEDLTASPSTLNLQNWFDQSAKKFVLLYFHSKGCVSCVKHMREFKDTLLKDPYFSNNPKFELVGVSTDPLSTKNAVIRFRDTNGFSFIKWLDDRGDVLRNYFLPSSMDRFGVPVAVMLSRQQVLWSYANTDEYTADELGARIKATVGAVDEPQPGPDDPDPVPDPNNPDPQPGPDDPLEEPDHDFQQGTVLVKLSDLVKGADYTVVNTFSELCLGCIEELHHWSEPGNVFDLCQKPKCQIVHVENGVPEEEPTAARYARLRPWLDGDGLSRAELLLDPHPSEGDEYLKRYFDGYLTEKFPAWGGLFGAVVYHDGKLVKDFVSGDGTALKDFLEEIQ